MNLLIDSSRPSISLAAKVLKPNIVDRRRTIGGFTDSRDGIMGVGAARTCAPSQPPSIRLRVHPFREQCSNNGIFGGIDRRLQIISMIFRLTVKSEKRIGIVRTHLTRQ
jgi:hypothetical protein